MKLTEHMNNVLAFVKNGHEFKVDSKGRKFYIVGTNVRRSGSMLVTESQIKKAKEIIDSTCKL